MSCYRLAGDSTRDQRHTALIPAGLKRRTAR